MDNDIIIFDRHRVRHNRDRAAQYPDDHKFLHDFAAKSLCGRLDDIKHHFPLCVSIGATGSNVFRGHEKTGTLVTLDLAAAPLAKIKNMQVQASEEALPFAAQSLDLVLSPLVLHMVNDLPGTLLQIRQALKPDGLFLAAMLGGETLHELRTVLAEAELSLRGGVSPRISPFADMPETGALLQRAGFNLPVIDSEIVTVTYDNAFRLMQDLRYMGEGNAILRRDRSFAGRDFFMETARLYQEKFAEEDGRIVATFEIIFMIGWAPHESQQKPLRRGSAQFSLAEALQTTETGL